MNLDMLSTLSMDKVLETITSCAVLGMEAIAQLPLGQTIFRFTDRFLWVIEKSAEWSLPYKETATDENQTCFGKMELVRPLPWIFFLPMLILLRLFRVGLNIGSFFIGWSKMTPCSMVKFLQKSRKRLRAIKTSGMKSMRQRKVRVERKDSNANYTKWRTAELIRSIQMTLYSMSCLDGSKLSPSPPPTRIKVRMYPESTLTPDEKSTTESVMSPEKVHGKRNFSNLSSEDHLTEDSEEETLQDKIDRLAAINDSMDDEEYNPGDISSLDNDDATSLSAESNVSASEIQDIRNEANLLLHRISASVPEVIKEEPEVGKRIDAEPKTVEDEKFENPSTDYASENSEEQPDYHSPCKFGDDGEVKFYSPISSTSPSPDRMVPSYEKAPHASLVEGAVVTSNTCQNGEANDGRKSLIPGPPEKGPNGHTMNKRPSSFSAKNKQTKNRGRRVNHDSRKMQ